MRIAAFIPALFALLLLAGGACSTREPSAQQTTGDPPGASADSSEVLELSRGNALFAFRLYRELSPAGGNLFFSPYSISTALAMTYAGARGATREEMAEVLEFSLPEDVLHTAFNALDSRLSGLSEGPGGFELHIANALWGQTGYHFLDDFLDRLDRWYGAGIRYVDFAEDTESCRHTINEWISDRTRQRITDLIGPDVLTPLTRLVLTNAIYFKAPWLHRFDRAATSEGSFALPDGGHAGVPMMRMTESFPILLAEGYGALELPYEEESMSMLLIVPDEGRFHEIEEMLGEEFVDHITSGLRERGIVLGLPRFGTVSEFQLEDALSSMGMTTAFGTDADFSGMDGGRDLFISNVVHKAFITVDEQGTEAAAATAVVMEKRIGDTVEFIVDRPFIFLIRERSTGTVLFMGRILDPAA